jgi:3-deoxy-D-arabino-heptulosonate 7-phosphate (DAHP) synthase
LVETHCHPEKALSDGPQALLPSDFIRLVEQAEAVHRALQAPSLTGLWM